MAAVQRRRWLVALSLAVLLTALGLPVLVTSALSAAHAQACTCDARPIENRLAVGEIAVSGTVRTVDTVRGETQVTIELDRSYNSPLAGEQATLDARIDRGCPMVATVGAVFAAFVRTTDGITTADSGCATLTPGLLAAAAGRPSITDTASTVGWTTSGSIVALDEAGHIAARGDRLDVVDIALCPDGSTAAVLDRAGSLRLLRLRDLALGGPVRSSQVRPVALVACHNGADLTVSATTVDGRLVVLEGDTVLLDTGAPTVVGGSSPTSVTYRLAQSSGAPVSVFDVRTRATVTLTTNLPVGAIDVGPGGETILLTRRLIDGTREVSILVDTDLANAAVGHQNTATLSFPDDPRFDEHDDVFWLSHDAWTVRSQSGSNQLWSVYDRSGTQLGLIQTGRSQVVRPSGTPLAALSVSGKTLVRVAPTLETTTHRMDEDLAGAATLLTPVEVQPRSEVIALSIASTTTSSTSTPTTTSTVRPLTTTPAGVVRSTVVTPEELVDGPGSDTDLATPSSVPRVSTADTPTSASAGDSTADSEEERVVVPVERLDEEPAAGQQAGSDDLNDVATSGSALDGGTAATASTVVVTATDSADGGFIVDERLRSSAWGTAVVLLGLVAIMGFVIALARWWNVDDGLDADERDRYFTTPPSARPADPQPPPPTRATRPASSIPPPQPVARPAAADSMPPPPRRVAEDWSGRTAGSPPPLGTPTPAGGISTLIREAVSEQD